MSSNETLIFEMVEKAGFGISHVSAAFDLFQRLIDEVTLKERQRIIEILESNNPRDNGKSLIFYGLDTEESFDDGWLVAIETKLHEIRKV
jgi:hypothetical protein